MFKNDVSNINKWSSTEIEVICDDCNKEKTIKYKLYTSYGYSDGMYLCRTCKTKKSNLEKWGAENPFKLDSVKEKIKSTNLERLGVENPSQSPYIQEKIRENNLRKLGVEHHSKLDSTKEKIKSTNLERLGVENPSQSDEIKRKKSETSIKNWGTSVPLHSDTIKEKIKADNLEKWGNENYLLTENFKTKANKTNLEKWGHTNPTMNKDIKLKIKNSVLDKLHKRMMEDNNIIKIDSEKRIFILNCQNCNNNYEIGYFLFYKRRETKTEICTICNPIDKHQSGKEIALYNFIKSVYDGEIIQNWRTNNKEIDIYLPDKSIGF